VRTEYETCAAAGARLPRLVYLADVPVESSYHGSALLFRLLQDWPAERLRVIESDLLRSQPDRRLPVVHYAELQVGSYRLLHTRFAQWYGAWLLKTTGRSVNRVTRLLAGFRPEAVLTVTHGFSWLTAARFAAQHGLPLHLICHDDLPRSTSILKSVAPWLEGEFCRVYRNAASRLCVSPFMSEEYRRRYGVEGTVLYPSRAADAPKFNAPPDRVAWNDQVFTVAFAGTINSPGYVRALKMLAASLAAVNGRLLIFGPLTSEAARSAGLDGSNIVLGGLVKSSELIYRLRAEADALFVPMSFDAVDRANMEISFPSKLADYTTVGLPLLVYGPHYCSAVHWARENPDVSEVVTVDNAETLAKTVGALAETPARRAELGARALAVGDRYFSCAAARSVFRSVVADGSRGTLTPPVRSYLSSGDD
jgi:glycosyltransferase involved in cell wall biosynthesis